ncbi:AI-2E family transporter [Sediminitomix flava]|uniref:Putative PurR-regulated permease PerM n=1 Tax=Sediminitomix flava TaxID=379075 RepID=A0A315ZJF5_SEDFL|nr:AI-2E family transporter [Sediminitomix flava]PWJ44824.1 putative PurR-regulated permease PerM [Sediminitomix flava]
MKQVTSNKLFGINKQLLILTVVAAMLWGIVYVFSDIITYLVISYVLTTILRPVVTYLQSFQVLSVRIPKSLAILLAFTLLIGFVALFIDLFVPLVSEQIKVISNLNYTSFIGKINKPIDFVEEFLISNGVLDQEKGFIWKNIQAKFTEWFDQGEITTYLNNIFSFTGSLFVGLMAVLFITFFFLYDNLIFKSYLISQIPNRYFEVSIVAISKTEHLLSNYMLGLFTQMIIIFSMISIGMIIVGVDYAVIIAVFTALANLIPYLGPILGAAFGLFVGISTTTLVGSENYLFLSFEILSVFGIVQVTDNIFIQPLIFSRSVKTHPLVIFLAVFIGAELGGVVGMIIAIPFFTILSVILGEFIRGYKEYQIFRINT